MNKRGYSLVELLVAAAILGSGLAGVMTAYRNMDETNARAKTNVVTKSLYRQIKKRVSSRVGELVCGPKDKDGTLQLVKSIRDRGRRQVKYQPVDFFKNSPKTTPWQLVSVKGQSNNQVGCLNDEAFDGAKKELLNYLLGSASGTEHVCAKKIELVPKDPVKTGGTWGYVESDDVYLCEHENDPSKCTYPLFKTREDPDNPGKPKRVLQPGWERVKLQQYMAYLRVHLHKPRRFGSGNKSATVARALFVDFPVYFSVNGSGSGSTGGKLVDCTGLPLTSKHITKGFKDFVVNTKKKGRGLEVMAAAKKHRTQTVKVKGRDTASTGDTETQTEKAIGDRPHYEDHENILADPDKVYGKEHGVCKNSGVVLRCPGTYHPFVRESFLDIVAGSDKQTPWVSAGSANLEHKLKSVFPNNCGCKVLSLTNKSASFDIAKACAEDSAERRSLDQCLHTQCDIGVSFSTTFDNKCIKQNGTAGGDKLSDIWGDGRDVFTAGVDEDDDKSALNAWRKSVQEGEGESYEACRTGCDSVNLMQGGDEQHKGKYWPVLVSDFMQGGKDANFDNTKNYVKRYQCMRCVLDDLAVCPHVSGAVGLSEVEKFDTLRACMFRAVHTPRRGADGKIEPESDHTFASDPVGSTVDKVAAIDIKENLKDEGVKSLWCAEDSKAEYEGLCGEDLGPNSVKLRDDCEAATKSCGSLIGGGVAQFFNTNPIKKDDGTFYDYDAWNNWKDACDDRGSVPNYWCQIIKNGCTDFALAEHLTPLSTDWTQAQYGDDAWWAKEMDWSLGPAWGTSRVLGPPIERGVIHRQAQMQHNYHRYWCKIDVPQEDGSAPEPRHVGVAVNQSLAIIRLDKSEITRGALSSATDPDLYAIGQLHLTSTNLNFASVDFEAADNQISNTNVLALDPLGFFRPDDFKVEKSIRDSFLVNNSDNIYGAAHPKQFRDKNSAKRKKAQARTRACYENHDHTKSTGPLDLNSPRKIAASDPEAKKIDRWSMDLFDAAPTHSALNNKEFSVQYEMQEALNVHYDAAFIEAKNELKNTFPGSKDIFTSRSPGTTDPPASASLPSSPPSGTWDDSSWSCDLYYPSGADEDELGDVIKDDLIHIHPLVGWNGYDDSYTTVSGSADITHPNPGNVTHYEEEYKEINCSRSYSDEVTDKDECGCIGGDRDPDTDDCIHGENTCTQYGTENQRIMVRSYKEQKVDRNDVVDIVENARNLTASKGLQKVNTWLGTQPGDKFGANDKEKFFSEWMYQICDKNGASPYNMPVYNFAFLCGKNVVDGTSDNNKLFPTAGPHETVGGAATPLPLGCCLHYAKKYDEYDLIDDADLPTHLEPYKGRIYYMGPEEPEGCFQWTLNSFDKNKEKLTE